MAKKGDGWIWETLRRGENKFARCLEILGRLSRNSRFRTYGTCNGDFLDKEGNPTHPEPGQFDAASHIPWLDYVYHQ